MYASNFPTDSVFTTYRHNYDGFSQAITTLSDSEQDKIFRGNARQWYRF
ncbi:hypothetical protein JCM19239_2062 [Vibrio variabilis]|uniref:Amidohydrolase-related domain-containing protein n=1 Tax=Vibrio variabilis TaxID=990271 RepID=A0ABQ0JER5_9VIBR|nr:hypothetical protein JCM19239_2062 [Vibrio variabilis]